MAQVICGVDIASRSLEVRIGFDGPSQSFPNHARGIAELAAFCRLHAVELVAMEATGGYEKQPFSLLWAHGIPVVLLHPQAVRRFAQSMGRLEKTDRIDAGIIAWFASVKRLAPLVPPSATQQRLQAMVTRLRQLTELQTAQRHQRRLVTDSAVLQGFTQLLALVAAQIRQLQSAIAQHIQSDPLWHELDQTFRSIKGVADRTVAALLAELPEIGTLSNKAIAKLAGLAPLACDSGPRHGPRAIRGGRGAIRHLLFLIASVVRRFHPDFQAFDQRLRAAGKAKKVILVALAHKLLVRLNAKAREVRQQHLAPKVCAT